MRFYIVLCCVVGLIAALVVACSSRSNHLAFGEPCCLPAKDVIDVPDRSIVYAYVHSWVWGDNAVTYGLGGSPELFERLQSENGEVTTKVWSIMRARVATELSPLPDVLRLDDGLLAFEANVLDNAATDVFQWPAMTVVGEGTSDRQRVWKLVCVPGVTTRVLLLYHVAHCRLFADPRLSPPSERVPGIVVVTDLDKADTVVWCGLKCPIDMVWCVKIGLPGDAFVSATSRRSVVMRILRDASSSQPDIGMPNVVVTAMPCPKCDRIVEWTSKPGS